MKHIKDENSPGRALGRVGRLALLYFDKELSCYGLGRGNFHILKILYSKDGLRQQDISREMKVDKSTVTRVVNNLVRLGYVRRRPDPRDGRVRRLYLTAKAKKIEPDVAEVFGRFAGILVKGFSKKEREQVMTLFDRLRHNLLRYHGISDDEEFFTACGGKGL